MLRFGFFEDIKGSNALLIWGDTQGLSHLQQLFARFSTGAETRAEVNAIEGACALRAITVVFELGQGELHVGRGSDGTTIVGRYSAERFAQFADKISALVDPRCKSGHHYLDWPGVAAIQIIVSKGEYPENFGAAT